MNAPAHRSPPVPALVFVVLVGLALQFGAVQELVVYAGREGASLNMLTGTLGAIVSGLMLASAFALWRGVPNARRLAVVTTIVTLGFCAFVMTPSVQIVGWLALLLSVLASAVLAWVARHHIDLAPGPQPG